MPNTCIVTGNVKNLLGENVEDCVVKVSVAQPFFHGSAWISGEIASEETDSSGNFSVDVIETASVGKKVAFTFEYNDGSDNTKKKAYSVVVPDEETATLADLVSENNIPSAPLTFPAGNVTVNPAGSLESTNVQDALEELQADLDLLDPAEVTDHIDDPSGAHAASAISVTPAGNLAADDVQEALTEIQTELDAATAHISDSSAAHAASAIAFTPAGSIIASDVQAAIEEVDADVTAHVGDATAAHAASAVSNTPSGNLAATDVQAALNELQSDVDTRALDSDLDNHVADTTAAHAASAIAVTPAGNLAADDVQEALTELQTDVDTRATSSALSAHESDTSTHGVGEIVGRTESQTLTNKTLTAPVMDVVTWDDQASTPATPSAGNYKTYFKTDGKMYKLDPNGAEIEIGSGGGGGGINYIDNNDAESDTSGWGVKRYAHDFATTDVSTGSDWIKLQGYLADDSWLGKRVRFTSTTTLPGGLSANTTYYVKSAANDGGFLVIMLSTSLGGSTVDITSTGSGTHTLHLMQPFAAISPTLSGTTTWTRTTSNPLRGDACFLLTKDAANRAGEIVYVPFTVDRADLGKVIKISADMEVASGTFADDDLAWWIQDADTNVYAPIQPAPYLVKNAVGSFRWQGEFQTSTTQDDYILCLCVNSNSTSAYTVKVDNIVVGPEARVYGPPVTDWQSFTPTGSWIANSTYTGKWRRVGDTMEVQTKIALSGAPTAATLTVNLPSGFSIDTAKMIGTSAFLVAIPSSGVGNDSGTQGYLLQAVYNTATSVGVVYQSATTGADTGVGATAPFTWGNGDDLTITYSVPIAGWSSNVQVSSDADTRAVAMYRTNTAGTSLDTAGTPAAIPFATLGFDTHSAWDGTNHRFVAPVPGYYHAHVNVTTTSSASGRGFLQLRKNGTAYATHYFDKSSSTASVGGHVSGIVHLNAGEYIDVGFAVSGGGTASLGTSTGTNSLSIAKVGGPAQIAASVTVECSYYANSSQTINNGVNTYIDFPVKVTDSHGMYEAPVGSYSAASGTWSTSQPTWRAKSRGKYRIIACVWGSGWGTGGVGYTITTIEINGVGVAQEESASTNAARAGATCHADVVLNADDTIRVQCSQNKGTNASHAAVQARVYLMITRIGLV